MGFGKKELDGIGELKEKETARRRKKSQSNHATTDSSEESWRATAEKRLEISLSESKEFNDLWWRAYRYLLYADNVLRDLSPAQDRLEWFINAFEVPQEAAQDFTGRPAPMEVRVDLGNTFWSLLTTF